MADLYVSQVNAGKSTYLTANSLPVTPIITIDPNKDILKFNGGTKPVLIQCETNFDTGALVNGDKIAVAVREGGVKVLQFVYTLASNAESIPMWKFGKLLKPNTSFEMDCTATGTGGGFPVVTTVLYGQVLEEGTPLFG